MKTPLWLAAFAFCLLPSFLQAQDFYWSGTGSGPQFSNPENWDEGIAPTDSSYVFSLNFSSGSPLAENNLINFSSEVINFAGSGFTITGNAIDGLYQINFFNSAVGLNTLDVPLNVSNGAFVINLANYGELDQHLDFRQAVTSQGGTGVFAAGPSTLDAGISFSGSAGSLEAGAPTLLGISQLTVDLDNSESINTARLSSNYSVEMFDGGRLRLIGHSSASEALVQQVTALQADGSNILEVQNNGSSFATVLQINALSLEPAGLLLSRSTGEPGEVLGGANGPQIHFVGTGSSPFLGPQQYYMSGDLENGTGFYEYAAYDPSRGVISASTGTDTLRTANNNTANILQTQNILDLIENPVVNSLAFNADTLEGTGTITLSHLLITREATAINVGLNFGNRQGTITTDSWDVIYPAGAYVGGSISGSNSLTFRGGGDVTLGAANSFSGTVQILGNRVTLGDGGTLNQVSAVVLGAQNSVSTLALRGGLDRLADNAQITIAGTADFNAFSDNLGLNESVGHVTVTAAGTDPDFDVASIRVNVIGSGEGAAANVTLASLTFANSSSNARVALYTYHANDSITINGGPIVLKNGNALEISLGYNFTDGTHITLQGGVQIEADAEGSVFLGADGLATLTADLDLQGGELSLSPNQGLLTLEGDLAMGQSLDTFVGLFDADISAPLISLDGDITLDGTLYVQQYFGYTEGSWLLFDYTGNLVNNGWDVVGVDGQYEIFVDETNKQVFLNAVPEPTAGLLLAAGLLGLCLRRSRRNS